MDKLKKHLYQFLLETNMPTSKPFAKKSKSKFKKKKSVLEKGLQYNRPNNDNSGQNKSYLKF